MIFGHPLYRSGGTHRIHEVCMVWRFVCIQGRRVAVAEETRAITLHLSNLPVHI